MKPDYSFYIALGYVSFLSIIIPLSVGVYRFRYLKNENRIFSLLIPVSIITETTIYILFKYRVNNLFVSRIQGIAEFVLLSFFFARVFASSSWPKFVYLLIFVFLGVAFFDLSINGFNSLDNISLATECFLLMIYSILAFFRLVQNPVYENILAAPLFWFNTGILTYFSGNLFLFVFSNYVETHFAKLAPALWGIHSALNIVFYLLITLGFWKTKAQT